MKSILTTLSVLLLLCSCKEKQNNYRYEAGTLIISTQRFGCSGGDPGFCFYDYLEIRPNGLAIGFKSDIDNNSRRYFSVDVPDSIQAKFKIILRSDLIFANERINYEFDGRIYCGQTYKIEYHDTFGRRIAYFDPVVSNQIQKVLINEFDKLLELKSLKSQKPFDVKLISKRAEFELRQYWFAPPKLKNDIKFTPPNNE